MSANGLEKTLSDVNGWIAGLPKDVASQVNSASIDVLDNRVVIDVVNSPVGQALNLPTLLANVKVMLSPGGGGPVERGPLAGDTYITTAGELPKTPISEISVCSLGFNAVDDSGQAVNISAGHCNPAEVSSRRCSSPITRTSTTASRSACSRSRRWVTRPTSSTTR